MSDDAASKHAPDPAAGCAGCPFHQWREDFPIRWDNDHYVSRRELARFLTVGSVLLAGANAALVGVSLTGRRPMPRTRIASLEALRRERSLLFRYPTERDPCILVEGADGQPAAYSQLCTHLSCAVVFRPDERVLHCPCHHGYFEIEGGRPIQGPPTRRLPRIRLEVQGDDILAVGVEV